MQFIVQQCISSSSNHTLSDCDTKHLLVGGPGGVDIHTLLMELAYYVISLS